MFSAWIRCTRRLTRLRLAFGSGIARSLASAILVQN
jgi:hypothetical protein